MDTNITLQCVFDLLADAELQYQVSWYINDGLIMEETLAENISVGVLREDQLTTLSYSDSVCCTSSVFLMCVCGCVPPLWFGGGWFWFCGAFCVWKT